MQREDHVEDMSWVPLSLVTCVGTPNLATQFWMKESVTVAASMSWSGTASNHLDDLSIMVSRYLKPLADAGKGPTKSMCTCVKQR